MKFLILAATFLITTSLFAQKKSFPVTWTGDWKGEVVSNITAGDSPMKVSMELRIHPTFKADIWSWQIIYGAETEDNRAYKLIAKDTSGIHWVIDENNGILLDQYWVSGKLCGAFTVGNSTIINSYWVKGDSLMVEIYSMVAKPIATTGGGTADSPKVDSYKIGGYQQAVLKRVY